MWVIESSTGGLRWIACALGHKACRDGKSVFYQRVPRLFEALALARGDGRYGRLLKMLGRVQLLILVLFGVQCAAMANLRAFAKSNQISADSGIPLVSLPQRGMV